VNKYTSSIINKYGDPENIKSDYQSINDILARQGQSFIIDCMAEHIGRACLKFKLESEDRERLFQSSVCEFREAILERI